MEKSAGDFYMVPPATANIARAYAKRNIATDRIPALMIEKVKGGK
jgi:hypothetical protein